MSLDGAKYHVSEIITKLGVSSRYEAAAWRPRAEERGTLWALPRLVRGHLRVLPQAFGVSIVVAAIVVVALLAWGVSRGRPPYESASTSSLQPQVTLPSGGITSIAVATPDLVWGAGPGGVFRSVDGGRSWSLASVSPQPLYGIAAAPDGRHGWAVGGLGTILSTDDGAVTWRKQPTSTQVNLSQIAVLDNETALVAGIGTGYSDVGGPSEHVLLRTTDGGGSWGEVRIDGGAGVESIDFLADRKRGWVTTASCPDGTGRIDCANPDHALFRTDDGGRSWHEVLRGAALSLLRFVDENVGWAASSSCDNSCVSAFVRTSDGGATWQTVHTPGPTSFFAFDEQTAIINDPTCGSWTSDTERVCSSWRTDDGGQTWRSVKAPSVYSSDVISFIDRDHAVSGSSPRWSDDGGNTWHDADFPAAMGAGAIDLVDDQHGWYGASKLLRTVDGGTTWLPVSDLRFTALAFITPNEGWGSTTSPRTDPSRVSVLHTTDGGTTWREERSVEANQIPRIVFVTRNDGWVLFEGDGRALRTMDGGQTWHGQSLPTISPSGEGAPPGRVAFSGADTGWAAGPRGQFYSTADGGDTWNALGDFGAACGGVSEISSAGTLVIRIVAFGCDGREWLYQSYDGGGTWSSTTLAMPLTSVAFFDRQRGEAVTNVCDQGPCTASRVVRTYDGGRTWSPEGEVLPLASASTFASPGLLWLESVERGHFSAFSARLYRYVLPPPPPSVSMSTGIAE